MASLLLPGMTSGNDGIENVLVLHRPVGFQRPARQRQALLVERHPSTSCPDVEPEFPVTIVVERGNHDFETAHIEAEGRMPGVGRAAASEARYPRLRQWTNLPGLAPQHADEVHQMGAVVE